MRLLIVSPRAFVSGWGADTPRLLQMSRGLCQIGWEVELLRCKHPEDHRVQRVIEAFPGRIRTAPFFGPFSSLLNRKGLRRAVRLWWRFRGQLEQSDCPELTAARFSRFARALAVPSPDLVFGITTGQLESFASARELSGFYRCPLVLEFRDPIPHPGSPPLEPRRRSLLETCLSRASLIITTTDGLRDNVAREFKLMDGKVRTIYSCYDDEAPLPANAGSEVGRLVLVHAGALHGGERRNARSLVKAIAQAAKDEESVRGRICLRLIGAGKGGVEAVALAQELGVPWAVEVLPQMPHNDCLAEMNRAHVLVVIKFDDAEYDLQIPGKTFQYLGQGKPILGIMRETEAARILRRSGLGTVLDHSNIAGISAALLDFWKHRDALDKRFRSDAAYIEQFSLGRMSRNFDRELTAVLTPKAPNAKTTGTALLELESRS